MKERWSSFFPPIKKKPQEELYSKYLPGPRLPPESNRPSRKMTALSYSWTTWNVVKWDLMSSPFPTALLTQTIRKVNFLSKNFTIFSGNQSCQQLKSTKPQHFHEFSPKTFRQFYREIKVDFFGQKNEDFEQCVTEVYLETNAKRKGESDHDQAPGYGGKEPSA
mgnify:CR=1 FL=1